VYAKTNGHSAGLYDLLLAVDVEPFRMTKRAKRLQPDISNSDELWCSPPAYTHHYCLLFIIRAAAGRSVYIHSTGSCSLSCIRVYCIHYTYTSIHSYTLLFCRRSCSIFKEYTIAILYEKKILYRAWALTHKQVF